MQPHQERVVKEKEELDDKLCKLSAFLVSEKSDSLEKEEKIRMIKQEKIMQDYSKILEERINNFS